MDSNGGLGGDPFSPSGACAIILVVPSSVAVENGKR